MITPREKPLRRDYETKDLEETDSVKAVSQHVNMLSLITDMYGHRSTRRAGALGQLENRNFHLIL